MNRRLHVKVARGRVFRRAVLVIAALAPLSACDEAEEILGNVGDNEVFEFRYAYATYDSQNDVYQVQRGSAAGNCSNPTTGNLTLAQLADLIQAKNTSYGMHACAISFLVAGDDAEAVRNNGVLFGVQQTGGANLTIYGNGQSTTITTEPSGIVIITSGGINLGQKTTLGYAEISFGTTGDVWSCADGGPVWSDNASGANATFFEILVTQLDDTNKRASGEFQCIARNTTDQNDTRLLLIIDGGFSMNINN